MNTIVVSVEPSELKISPGPGGASRREIFKAIRDSFSGYDPNSALAFNTQANSHAPNLREARFNGVPENDLEL